MSFGNFGILEWTAFVLGKTYLHQTFIECVFDQFKHYDILICQM